MGTLPYVLLTLTFYIHSNISCPEGYSQCATEGATCSQTGIIAYGSGSRYTYQQSSSSITCNVAGFGGDPTPTLTNECCSQSTAIAGIKTPIVGAISCGETVYSHFGYMTDKHYWKLTTNGQFDILYTTCESSFDTRLNIYNSANNIISLTECSYVTDTTKTGDDCNEGMCTLANDNEYFTMNTQVAGTYYAEVVSYNNDGNGNYQLRVSCSPTVAPTSNPTSSTASPSHNPTLSPTQNPSVSSSSPTLLPTLLPSITPTLLPTKSPTNVPSISPITTKSPTTHPTAVPTARQSEPTTIPTNNDGVKQMNENGKQSSSNTVAIVVLLVVVLCCCMVILLAYVWHRKRKQEAVDFATKVKNSTGEAPVEGVDVITNGTEAPPGTIPTSTPIGTAIEMQSVSDNNQTIGQFARINSMSSIDPNTPIQPALTMEEMQQHMNQMQQTMNNGFGGNNMMMPMALPMVGAFQNNNGVYGYPAQYNINTGSNPGVINPSDVNKSGDIDDQKVYNGQYKTEGQ